MPVNDLYLEKMAKKCRFSHPFELNWLSLSAVNQHQNLLGTTSGMCVTFSPWLRFIALIVFDIKCLQNLDKLIFFMLVE